MLQFKQLKKSYAGRTVVNIENLTIAAGETIGLVGNNGAGKTTMFRMLLDLIRPDSGEILSKEANVASTSVWKDYTASYLDEGFLIDYLTPEEYFIFIGSLHDLSIADVNEYLKQYEEFFNGEILSRGKYIRDFSKGNQNKVGIAAALMQKPELLVLDEPFANLDPTTVSRLKKIIKDLADNPNVTVLVSSHDLQHTVEVCDRIVALNKGEVVKDIQTSKETLQELESFFAV